MRQGTRLSTPFRLSARVIISLTCRYGLNLRRWLPGDRPVTYTSLTTACLALCLIFTAPARFGASDRQSPIEQALGFLFTHQVRQPLDSIVNGVRVVDWPGDWPQYFALQGNEAFRVRDVSPFTVAFIHHALTHIVEDNRRV